MLTAFETCIRRGGVAVFPSDTVYGLACDPQDEAAVARLYELKGRPPDKPSAVMFFDLGLALSVLPHLGPRTRGALERLLPGGVTLLLPNPDGLFPLACGPDPGTLGLRVPAATPLRGARVAVLQSSANHAGGADPRTLDEVPQDIRRGARLVLGAGALPGVASTVVDFRRLDEDGTWSVVRQGAVPAEAVAGAIGDGA